MATITKGEYNALKMLDSIRDVADRGITSQLYHASPYVSYGAPSMSPKELIDKALACCVSTLPSTMMNCHDEWNAYSLTGPGSLYETIVSELCNRYVGLAPGLVRADARRSFPIQEEV